MGDWQEAAEYEILHEESDLKASSNVQYEKEAVLYMHKATPIFSKCFTSSRAVGIIADEVRCSGKQVLGTIVGSLQDNYRRHYTPAVPFQHLPDSHVDLEHPLPLGGPRISGAALISWTLRAADIRSLILDTSCKPGGSFRKSRANTNAEGRRCVGLRLSMML